MFKHMFSRYISTMSYYNTSSSTLYSDPETVEELIYQFAVDQYNEFTAVDDGTADLMTDTPVWCQLCPGERRIIELQSIRIEPVMDRYAERWMDLQEEYNWSRTYQDEILDTLPDDTVYGYREPRIQPSSSGKELFRNYVDRHADTIQQADGPGDLEDTLDDETTLNQARYNGSYWFESLWAAVNIGDPPIQDRLDDDLPDRDPQLLTHAAHAMDALDDLVSTLPDNTSSPDYGRTPPRRGS